MRYIRAISAILMVLLAGCAYYNTFYNARKAFNDAERARQQVQDNRPSTEADRLYDQAIESAAKVLQFYPDSKWVDDALVLIGKAFYQQRKYPQAVRKYQEVLANYPTSKWADYCYYGIGEAYYGAGDLEPARTAFNVALQQIRKSQWIAESRFMLGQIAYDEENYQQAVDLFRAFIEAYPKHSKRATAWFLLGESLFKLDAYDQARTAYLNAARYEHGWERQFKALFQAAECLRHQGLLQQALDDFKKLQQDRYLTFLPQLRVVEAACLAEMGALQEALTHYEQVVATYPKAPATAQALYDLGMLYLKRLWDVDKAEEYLSQLSRQGDRSSPLVQEARQRVQDIKQWRTYQAVLSGEKQDSGQLAGTQADTGPVIRSFADITVDAYSAPAFLDIDRDGDLDLFVGSGGFDLGGRIIYYRNEGTPTAPRFVLANEAYEGIDVGEVSIPTFADIDNDQDLDLFIGKGNLGGGGVGHIAFYRNTRSDSIKYFEKQPVVAFNQRDLTVADSLLFRRGTQRFAQIDVGNRAVPAFADIDLDGDLDLFVGSDDGQIRWYQNVGVDTLYNFQLAGESYSGIDVGFGNAPCFVDIDADDDYDLFVGNVEGHLYYYRNEGNNLSPNFVLVTDRFVAPEPSGYAIPKFADVDGDGDQDLILGNGDGNLTLYWNRGSAKKPLFGEEVLVDQKQDETVGTDSLAGAITDTRGAGPDSGKQPDKPAGQSETGDQQELAVRLKLATLYLFQFEQPDSALVQYQTVLAQGPDTPYAAQAAYGIAWIYAQVLHDSLSAQVAYQQLIDHYPESEQARAVRRALGMSVSDQPDDTALFQKAERLLVVEGQVDSALTLYQLVVDRFPTSPLAVKAQYAIAWGWEFLKQDREKAISAYQKLVDAYPESEQAKLAKTKLDPPPLRDSTRVSQFALYDSLGIEFLAPLRQQKQRVLDSGLATRASALAGGSDSVTVPPATAAVSPGSPGQQEVVADPGAAAEVQEPSKPEVLAVFEGRNPETVLIATVRIQEQVFDPDRNRLRLMVQVTATEWLDKRFKLDRWRYDFFNMGERNQLQVFVHDKKYKFDIKKKVYVEPGQSVEVIYEKKHKEGLLPGPIENMKLGFADVAQWVKVK